MYATILKYTIRKSSLNDVTFWIRECFEASKTQKGLKYYKVFYEKQTFTHYIEFVNDMQFDEHINLPFVKLFLERINGCCDEEAEFITVNSVI